MKVILTERVKTLGNIGEIVNVSAGHARNFLFPNKLAIIADEGNVKQITNFKKKLAKKVSAEKSAAEAIKAKIEGQTYEFIKKVGASGKLFGTLTTQDIANEFEKKGYPIERKQIVIEDAIKTLGTFDVKAKIFQDVVAKFKVTVKIDPAQVEELKKQMEEAKEQKKQAKERAELQAKMEAEAAERAARGEMAEAINEDALAERDKKRMERPKKKRIRI